MTLIKINDFKNYFFNNKSNVSEGNEVLDYIDTIEFRNVFFSYPGINMEILKNVSFDVKRNEKVMLVGLNGSGKTTILNLLTRFYQPDNGDIFINKKNINVYTIKSVRKCMSIVFQDYQIYDFTLKENIIISDLKNAEDNHKVREVLDIVDFNNKEYMKNKKIDYELSKRFNEEGIILSGGQKQKLAISRAVFRNSDLVILDEPTASLDPFAEKRLLNYYTKLYSNKTLIMVSHRLLNATCILCRKVNLKRKNIIKPGGRFWKPY